MTSPLQCCIAGGGPAGMMLGLLLAKAGCRVTVLEKHADFLRDFRGDTIHPSTLQVMHELGLLDGLLQRPHQKAKQISAVLGDTRVTLAQFDHLSVVAPYIAMMPQWDFLDFLAHEARRYPGFELAMQTEATDLIKEGETVVGVTARRGGAAVEYRADLVVACDGRSSRLRTCAGLKVLDQGAPIDVLWFRIPRKPADGEIFARFVPGHVFVGIDRGDYWQCAYVVPKNGDAAIRVAGLDAFRRSVVALAPFAAADRVGLIASFDDVKLLTVKVDRLEQWARPGFLAIGDAAHAMSPLGGVGINLAVQDAVAAANILAGPLRARTVTLADLERVQARRSWPTRATQAVQVAGQNRIIAPTLAASGAFRPPLALRLISSFPFLRRLIGRMIGLGFRPEHVSPTILASR
jgi:2-polyprenyl-6-methoxyphenol hydroxylase-like FAD-dependent oxidoreductase